MPTRDEMYSELKLSVIPALREIGFKGSMPHLHRINDGNHVDLLTFQFASGGGSFVVEIGFADEQRDNVYSKKDAPPAKLRVYQTRVRRRLGAADDRSDFWFAYDGQRPFGMTGDPKSIAEALLSLIQSQAVPWWDAQRQNGANHGEIEGHLSTTD